MSIRINATVNEARTAAKHSQEQWDRFYVGPSSDRKRSEGALGHLTQPSS